MPLTKLRLFGTQTINFILHSQDKRLPPLPKFRLKKLARPDSTSESEESETHLAPQKAPNDISDEQEVEADVITEIFKHQSEEEDQKKDLATSVEEVVSAKKVVKKIVVRVGAKRESGTTH